MVGYEEKALCRKIANTFEFAGDKKVFPPDFIKAWLQSDTAYRIYTKDFNEIAQSPVYIFNSFMLESDFNVKTEDNYDDILYWVGYMVTYMEFLFELSPADLWSKYDLIGFASAYDTLHTLTTKRAAEECDNEFRK